MNIEIDYPTEYDNSGRVKNSDALLSKHISDAADFREAPGRIADYDVEYGSEPRNKMDIFWPSTEAGEKRKSPIVMFIHGGYWHLMDRTAFSHLAGALNSHGIAVAIPSYTLCPDIDIEGIIIEMRRACLILFHKYKKRLVVAGHSAGGHLAACMMATDWESLHHGLPHNLVSAGMGISGIYDLTPLLKTPVNDAVRMSNESAIAASPINWIPDAIHQFEAWVGSEESNEYHRQSRELAARWSMLGTPTNCVLDEGTNHFNIISGLTQPKSALTERLVELVKRPKKKFRLPKLNEDAVLAQMQNFADLPPETFDSLNDQIDEKDAALIEELFEADASQEPAPEQKAAQPPKKKRTIKLKPTRAVLRRKSKAKAKTPTEPQPKPKSKPKATKPTPAREQPKASIGGKASPKLSNKKPAKRAQSKKAKTATKK